MLLTDHSFPGMLDWVDGKVLVVEVPSGAHGGAIGRIGQLMYRALGNHVDSCGSTSTLEVYWFCILLH